jgi:hypothetical protein
MFLGILITLATPQATSLAEPLVRPDKRADANKSAYADIFKMVRIFEESGEVSIIAPDATLELLDLPRSDRDRKRLWRNVPASGVASEPRVLRMAIARISSNRAIVDARTRSTVYDTDVNGKDRAEKPRIFFDRIELAQTGDGWLITSVARRIR